jgi:NAD-dependent SIR2 family protein deacetylase
MIASKIKEADGVVITAGAGMGVDAGIPDFRGKTGLWTAEKENFIKFADGSAFHQRPLEAWNFYIQRLMKYSRLEPHRGYHDLQKVHPDTFVVTSNVDGHFERSGWDPLKIYEIHGNLKFIQCSDHCCDEVQPMPYFEDVINSLAEAPHCPKCGAVSRPVVMMFNDMWFDEALAAEQASRYTEWAKNKKNIVGIEIGAGTAVPSIRKFGEQFTSMLIRVNPHDSYINRSQDISIPATAINGIETILNILGHKNE